MSAKPTIAVIFGGPTVEHDVSVLTGLQIIEAIDATRFDTLPVYISLEGEWLTGEPLRNRKTYLPDERLRRSLDRVQLAVGKPAEAGRWAFVSAAEGRSLFGRPPRSHPFDIAIPSIHGSFGEDGRLQGLLDSLEVPYVGCDVLGASVLMNKAVAKEIFRSLGIPVLPGEVIRQPAGGGFLDLRRLAAGVKLPFPLCVKPNNLGSSVGVSRARDAAELEAALAAVFKADSTALVEPLVPNLIEYNVAVTRALGDFSLRTSAIERPLRTDELLAFRDKYLAGGDLDNKLSIPFSEGMASATREINPAGLRPEQAANIRDWAARVFELLELRGTARADVLCNGETGELWLNEVNSFPGSLAYFLWEAADPPVNFTELLSALIEEAVRSAAARRRTVDPAQVGAAIFRRG